MLPLFSYTNMLNCLLIFIFIPIDGWLSAWEKKKMFFMQRMTVNAKTHL